MQSLRLDRAAASRSNGVAPSGTAREVVKRLSRYRLLHPAPASQPRTQSLGVLTISHEQQPVGRLDVKVGSQVGLRRLQRAAALLPILLASGVDARLCQG